MISDNASSDDNEVWKCGGCQHKVNYGEKGLQCEQLLCGMWFHASCLGMSEDEYKGMKKRTAKKWYCEKCILTTGEEERSEADMLEETSENPVTVEEEGAETPQVSKVTTRSKQMRKSTVAVTKRNLSQKRTTNTSPVRNVQISYSFITDMVRDRVTAEVNMRMLEIKNERFQEDREKDEERADLKRKVDELQKEVKQLSKKKRRGQECEPSEPIDLELEEISEEETEVEMLAEEVIPEYIGEAEGDILKLDPKVALCHCVGKDFWMSEGVAADFKDEFGGQDDLQAQEMGVGEVAVLKKYNKVVYYLVSKEKSTGKPKLADLVLCLIELKKKCIEDEVRELAMPRIGAGLDRLDWEVVKKEVNKVFIDSDIKVTAYKRPTEMAVVLADNSLGEVWEAVQGAVVLVDDCRCSTLKTMMQLVQDAPLTEYTQDVVIYLGACMASDAMDRGQEEVKCDLVNIIRAAKSKLKGRRRRRMKVVGAVPHSAIHRDVVRNVNKIIYDVCKAEGVKFRNPIKPFGDLVSWGVKGWCQEKKVVATTVAGYINSLLDC